MTDKIVAIAKVAHQANKAWCEANGDFSLKDWDQTPENIRNSSILGVTAVVDNPTITSEQIHQKWMDAKVADGYVYGSVKSDTDKTHPCLVPYSELPAHQKTKDALFISVVKALL